MPPDTTPRLLVAGQLYAGWHSLSVRRGMDQCAGAFSLGVSERWAERWQGQPEDWRIRPGEACQLLLGDEPVITGYVDEVQLEIDATTHQVQVSGRDATADLVDCSAESSAALPGQWRGQKVEAIAAALCRPFGLQVLAQADTGAPLASFALQEGESVFDAIERAARMRALLLMADGAGALVITRAGVQRVATELVLGQNVLSARAAQDMRDRYSVYTVKGQAPGSNDFNGAQVSQIKARAFDPDVPRHRPLVITHEAPDLNATLVQRARWEANVRAARSMDIEVQVQGWRHAAGLWQPNTLVRVRGDVLHLDHELLVRGVNFDLDEQGTRCTLALTRADAFTALELKETPATPTGPWWNMPFAKVVDLQSGASFAAQAGGG